MKKYKLFILGIMLLFSVFSLNAITYLNSCDGTALSSDTHYIYNMTTVPSGNPNSWCNNIPATANNITIQGNGQTINLEKAFSQGFFYKNPSGGTPVSATDITIIDLNIVDTTNSVNWIHMGQGTSGGNTAIEASLVERVNLTGFNSVFYMDSQSGQTTQFKNSNINDLVIINTNYFANGDTANSGFIYNNMSNILFTGVNIIPGSFTHNVNNVDDSVFVTTTQPASIGAGANVYSNSVISGYNHTDANDDNVADTDTYSPVIVSANIYKDKEGYRFVQDTLEGDIAYDVETNLLIVFTNDNELNFGVSALNLNNNGFNKVIGYNNLDYNLNTPFGVDLGTKNSIDCALFNNLKCFFNDNANTTVAGTFRPLIALNSDTRLNNIYADKFINNTNNLIANDGNVLKNNITISDSTILRRDNRLSNGNDQLIKLYANNVEITGNTFDTSGFATGNNYEILSIQATTPTSNKVHLNSFNSSLSNTGHPIFTGNCDAKFYNNRIDGAYNITNGCTGNLNVTPLVGYLHTDSKIYYFRIGNYYSAYVGCVDGDGDDICDSPYTSGSVTDTKPLASWPYDFVGNLLNAEYSTEATFNITLTQPVQDQSFNLTNESDIIVFGFSHDSNFTDLTCEYYIDAVFVPGSQILNTPSDTEHTINVNGWTTKTYTYDVACYNEFASISSPQITFDVNITGAPPIPPGETISGGNTTSLITGIDIIGDTPEETVDNVKALAGTVVNPFMNFGMIVLIVISIFLAIGLVVGLISLI